MGSVFVTNKPLVEEGVGCRVTEEEMATGALNKGSANVDMLLVRTAGNNAGETTLI